MSITNDILEGIKSAMARGENLEIAKLTFKNAGYSEEEVESAVRGMSSPQEQTVNYSQVNLAKQNPKKDLSSFEPPKAVQVVSSYGAAPKQSILQEKWFLVTLSVVLVILLGALGFLFYFKGSITSPIVTELAQ